MPHEREAWVLVLLGFRCGMVLTMLVALLFLLKQYGIQTQNIYSIWKTMTPCTQTGMCSKGETVRPRRNKTFQHYKIQFSQEVIFRKKD